MDEKLIANHMARLGISREEAIQLIQDDIAIDKGAKLFELEGEAAKAAKQARRADRKQNSAPIKRERKADADKSDIVKCLIAGITDAGVEDEGSLVVANGEREFVFTHNGRKFKVVLSCPRS